MYHARVDDEDKKIILHTFQPPSGTCRILFSTVAFGMWVDIPNVRTVIHYGPPDDVESYFQESGLAGRDGKQSIAIPYLYISRKSFRPCWKKYESIIYYCTLEADKCHREELLKHFPGKNVQHLVHMYCDQCTQVCECGNEHEHSKPLSMVHSITGDSDEDEASLPDRAVREEQIQLLRSKLMEFRSSLLLPAHSISLYVGQDL